MTFSFENFVRSGAQPARSSVLVILLAASLATLAGCDRSPCDDLEDLYCAFPFPSDRYLVPDPSTATGYRLDIDPRATPQSVFGLFLDVSAYKRLDGASPSAALMTAFEPPPDLSNAATLDSIARSLEEDSPTVIVDLATGERVAHWVELDPFAYGESPQVLWLRPAARLATNHRYGVAIRDLADVFGAPLEPPAGFRALRDGLPVESRDLDLRRAGMEELFAVLESAGIERASLVSAWWWHTASEDALRGDLLAMRADALARLGSGGIGCTVTAVEPTESGGRVVKGTVTTPWYLDADAPLARFARGADGRPTWVRDREVPFSAVLPASLLAAPGGPVPGLLVLFGHGLGESGDDLGRSAVEVMAERLGFVPVGTDFLGLSGSTFGAMIEVAANWSALPGLTEPLAQSYVDFVALLVSIGGTCRTLPELTEASVPLVDATRRYYVGASLGGVLGGAVLPLLPDVERGALLLGGSPFSHIINEMTAIDYLGAATYPRRIDRAFLLNLGQSLVDPIDSATWLDTVLSGGSGLPPKQLASVVASDDYLITPSASDHAARTAGLPVLAASVRQPFGLPEVEGPVEGRGYLVVHSLDHGVNDTMIEVVRRFLEEGVVASPCDGLCDPD